jgi:hypothetical protein
MPTSVGKQLKQFNLFYAAHISLLLPVIFISNICIKSVKKGLSISRYFFSCLSIFPKPLKLYSRVQNCSNCSSKLEFALIHIFVKFVNASLDSIC